MLNSRQYTIIQNYRHAKSWKHKTEQNYIWDTLEIDWNEVMVTFNENKINLSRVITIKLQDKIKVKTFDEQTTIAFPSNAAIRNYVVYFSHRHTGDCINNITN